MAGFGASSKQVRVPLGAFPRQPRPASVHTPHGNPPHIGTTEVVPPRERPAHPLPPALTPARAYEAVADPIRRPSTPKRVRLTRALGQARTFAIVPKKGPRSNLSRPKATELTKPSANRRSCSSPALQPAGKPAHRPATRSTPKHRACRRPRSTIARRPSSARDTRRSRAQSPVRPEGRPHELATHRIEHRICWPAATDAEAPLNTSTSVDQSQRQT